MKENKTDFLEIEKKIIKILDTKIRPAVAKDGGDIKFKEFKDGVVKVELQGSCSGCPSSTMTLKQGVQNLLCHYLTRSKRSTSSIDIMNKSTGIMKNKQIFFGKQNFYYGN